MTGMVGRFGRIFFAVWLQDASAAVGSQRHCLYSSKPVPVDPVQQYVLGAGGVSAEQRAQLEEYWGVSDPRWSGTSPG